MRSVGLAFLLAGTLFLLFPYYREWVGFIRMSLADSRIMGSLLIASGALALAVASRRTDG